MLLVKQQITTLLKTNLAESYPEFYIHTAYAIGDTRRDGNFYYKAAVAIDATNTIRPSDISTKWVKMRPSNRYAALDTSSLTTSTNDSIISYFDNTADYAVDELARDNVTGEFFINILAITGGGEPSTNLTNWLYYLPSSDGIIFEFDNPRYDIIGFGYVIGEKITIEYSEDDFNYIVWRDERSQYSWIGQDASADKYSYRYGSFAEVGDTYEFYKKMILGSGKLRVTIDPSEVDSGLAAIGYMVAGNSLHVGSVLDGVSFGYTDYSVKVTDVFGTIELTKRDAQRVLGFSVATDVEIAYKIAKDVRKLLATNLMIIGDENDDSMFENLLLLSYIEEFDINLESHIDQNISTWRMIEKI